MAFSWNYKLNSIISHIAHRTSHIAHRYPLFLKVFTVKLIVLMLINGKLKELRLDKGFTQKYITICTGIDQSRISRFESGKLSPTFEEADKILSCLGLKGMIVFEASK